MPSTSAVATASMGVTILIAAVSFPAVVVNGRIGHAPALGTQPAPVRHSVWKTSIRPRMVPGPTSGTRLSRG